MEETRGKAGLGLASIESRRGCGESFADFYQREYPTFVRLAFLLTRSTSVAEDLVQESFVAVHERFGSLDRPGAYMRVTLINRCRRRHRTRAREARRNRLVAAGTEPAPAAGNELFDVLGRLPERQRTVVVLRYWMGLSEREIAEALDCRPGTVKSLASRALAQLREELEQ